AMVAGAILVTPFASKAGWVEWGYCKAAIATLRVYGITPWVREYLLSRLFSVKGRGNHSDLSQTFRRDIQSRDSSGLLHMLQAVMRREDILEDVKQLKECNLLIIAGDQSDFYQDCLEMNLRVNKSRAAYIEVMGSGTVVSEENPERMVSSIQQFLRGMQYYGIGSSWNVQ
ncbi:hypothetical protein CYMTET_50930, partial [Cymbomonas tetramitiformis]